MKILVAPNALKGSLTAADASAAIADGARRACPDAGIRSLPVADGGDGLLDVLASPLSATREAYTVTGPLGVNVQAAFGYSREQRTAVIETAPAIGIALLDPEKLDPMAASSAGAGELVARALEHGAQTLIIGIGGSATVDGGTGMASALGIRFLDASGETLQGRGATLSRIERIDASGLNPALAGARILVACDVDNPLLGDHGAARVFGPQKGAGPDQVEALEAGLANLARVIALETGREVAAIPGAGAAGGLGAMLIGLLNAELQPGADLVLHLCHFDEALQGADLVITAEGRLDGQTLHGKAPAAVALRARAHGIPCIAIGGSLGEGYEKLAGVGIAACFSLCSGPMQLEHAMKNAPDLLARAAEQALRCFLAGR